MAAALDRVVAKTDRLPRKQFANQIVGNECRTFGVEFFDLADAGFPIPRAAGLIGGDLYGVPPLRTSKSYAYYSTETIPSPTNAITGRRATAPPSNRART
jgi:hypothetical protein